MQVEIGHLDRLKEDVEYCIQQHQKLDNKQFWRRTLVRSLFGLIECLVYIARKHFLLHRASIIKDSLINDHKWLESISQLLKATELSEAELTDQGKVKIRAKKHRSLPFIKANVRLFYYIFKNQEAEADQLFVSKDWLAVEQSMKIRDRLMHPKERSDVEVADEEYKEVLRAYSVILMLSASGLDIALFAKGNASTGQPNLPEHAVDRQTSG